ncbi:MAG TPA: septal ring lytic transglycosylase RlpA family protein [Solirubrobacteraceae bacterium]|nr:septal ring lytic transglycosylase RlpA family protein [Solirubrobacteraceae bacterium]
MRAIRRSRVPGAAKLATGLFLVTLPVVGLIIGSDSAAASGAVSRFVVKRGAIVRPSGSTVVVHGFLLPSARRTEVKLVARTGGRWRTLAIGRTRRGGRFGIRYRVRGGGATPVRVRYDGGAGRRAASAPAGKIVGLQPTVASWYDDAGNTACGFHATYGVANKTLPCGTKVTLSYGGRTVVATVDDRGPYVYGRSFDLNQNTAHYLGMWGVAQVLASV